MILSSGYDARTYSNRVEGLGLAGVLQKPYTLTAMTEVLECVLGGSTSS